MSGLRINKRILILCEGATEYIYAKSLQMELPRDLQRSVAIEIFYQTQNDPKSLTQEAHRRQRNSVKERNPYDDVWLFFDNDNWPQLAEAFELISKYGFRIAYTSICLEHWFILHFEHCGRSFPNGDQALNYLNRLWPAYHKTKINAYKELKERLAAAIDRANTINRNQNEEIQVHERNPYFTVHELIRFFDELKEETN
jgi:RloB-like protein